MYIVNSFYISTIVNKRPIRNFHMNNLLSTYCEKEFSLSMSSQKSFKEPFFQHSKFMEKFSTEVFYGNFLRNFYVEVFYGSFQNSDDIFDRSFLVIYRNVSMEVSKEMMMLEKDIKTQTIQYTIVLICSNRYWPSPYSFLSYEIQNQIP